VYRTLLRTPTEEIRILIQSDSSKDRVRALKNHPTLTNFRNTLEKVKEPSFTDKLKYLEEKLGGVFQYKFGVIYRKKGQVLDNDMLGNGTMPLLAMPIGWWAMLLMLDRCWL
jgi:hypothetical protein